MDYIKNLIDRREALKNNEVDIRNVKDILMLCYKNGNKVFICGNGGSCADSGHIQGELMKSFVKKRPLNEEFKIKIHKVLEELAVHTKCSNIENKYEEILNTLEQGLPTIDLTSFNPLNTAFANDKNWEYAFANSLLTLGKPEDVLIAISTSGNSKSILNACLVAKSIGMKVVALTGKDGGVLKYISDEKIIVPLNDTYLIQEEHLAIYHALCLQVEEEYFN